MGGTSRPHLARSFGSAEGSYPGCSRLRGSIRFHAQAPRSGRHTHGDVLMGQAASASAGRVSATAQAVAIAIKGRKARLDSTRRRAAIIKSGILAGSRCTLRPLSVLQCWRCRADAAPKLIHRGSTSNVGCRGRRVVRTDSGTPGTSRAVRAVRDAQPRWMKSPLACTHRHIP